MAKLKLGPIADEKPVKVTLELPASLHRDQRWPGKFGQWDKWKTCLRAAMVLRIRSEDDEANTAHA